VIIIGIDPSVRATAIVAVPLDWGGDWSKIKTAVIKGGSASNLRERMARNCRIAHETGKAFDGLINTFGWPPKFYIEDYAYSMKFKAHQLGELGGAIRSVLCGFGMVDHDITELPVTKARKLLLGKVPKANQKGATQEALWDAGARFGTIDEYDAMCIANFGLAEHGGHCFIGAQ
jgi:hypothetical protein